MVDDPYKVSLDALEGGDIFQESLSQVTKDFKKEVKPSSSVTVIIWNKVNTKRGGANSYTIPELKYLLSERGEKLSGNKAELVSRLNKYK